MLRTITIGKRGKNWSSQNSFVWDSKILTKLHSIGAYFTSLFIKFKVNIMTSTVEMCFKILSIEKRDKSNSKAMYRML